MPDQNKAALIIIAMINKVLGGKMDKLHATFLAMAEELKKDKQNNRTIAELLSNLRALENLKGLGELNKYNETFRAAITELERISQDRPSVDIRDGNRLLKQLVEKFNMPKMDMSKVETGLARVGEKLDKILIKDDPTIRDLLAGLGEAIKKIKMPDRIKLDDMDLRTIRSSGGVAIGSAPEPRANKVTIANTVMTTAQTEYSYAFPAYTVKFYMKLREQNAKFRYAWAVSQLATTYMTTPQNFLQSRDGVNYSGKTIYFSNYDGTNNLNMEIESYQE